MAIGLLWIPVTLIASAAQVARNAMQRRLTDRIGTVGATQVRFLYGFPFALAFLALLVLATGARPPAPAGAFAFYLGLGAIAQIAATALMLTAMRDRSFSVVTALIKTEAVQIALFGFLILGDRLSVAAVAGVLVATAGVVAMSWTPRASGEVGRRPEIRPVALGIGAGALFALSAVGFRGAILALDGGDFLLRATTTLAWSLGVQTAILLVYLAAFDRPALAGSFAVWRASLVAGFLGAFASQFWFIGFALTAAANVRTLALVEILMAQAVSRRFLNQRASRRELAGMLCVALGVAMLVASQP